MYRRHPCRGCDSYRCLTANCGLLRKVWPARKKETAVKLSAGQHKALAVALTEAEIEPEYMDMLLTIATMHDKIADGENIYMTFGSTRARDAYTWSVRKGDEYQAVYGADLLELAQQYQILLQSPVLMS